MELLCKTDEHGAEDDAQHAPQQIGDQETNGISEENNAGTLQRAIGLRADNRKELAQVRYGLIVATE